MATTSPRREQAKRFGAVLRRLRARAGMTQEALAEAAGISPRYVQALEQGLNVPSIYIGAALKKALKVDWDELVK